jgi:hypothetical protein
MITVIGILVGAVLGTRYKVLCLVPTTLAGIAAVVALDHINGVPPGSAALAALMLAVALQIGYVIGAMIRSRLTAPLAGSVREPRRMRHRHFLTSSRMAQRRPRMCIS